MASVVTPRRRATEPLSTNTATATATTITSADATTATAATAAAEAAAVAAPVRMSHAKPVKKFWDNYPTLQRLWARWQVPDVDYPRWSRAWWWETAVRWTVFAITGTRRVSSFVMALSVRISAYAGGMLL